MTEGGDRAFDTERVARLRQGLYRFFAAALLTPDAERLATLALVTQDFEGLETFAFYGAWQRLRRALHGLEADDVPAIEAAYDRFFAVSPDGELYPPHESFYLTSPGQASGMVIAHLERAYARLGLKLAGDLPISSDHATVELEVMAFLCDREAHAWEHGAFEAAAQALKEQRTFLIQHLGRWFSDFVGHVTVLDPGGLYSLVGEAADAFIHHDRDYLNLLCDACREANTGVEYAST